MIDNNYVINDLDNVDPSPIAPRVCACGCGITFNPRRSNQYNVNGRHTDKGYHQNVRKPKQKNQNAIDKIHRRNNRACEKYVEASQSGEAVCNWESLLADGLNDKYTHGVCEDSGIKYAMTYNYMYHVFKEDGTIKVKIKKQ